MSESYLEKYISKVLRITTTDGRAFFGVLLCTDRHRDLVLQDTTERRTDNSRFVGMVVIRGHSIANISVQC